jgi:hypothetical protein
MLHIIHRGHEENSFFAHAIGLSPESGLISVLPGNERRTEAHYACVIVVKDYFRMRAQVKESGEWHYSMLEPAILEDVRAGRAILVFDLCNEGPAYDEEIFSELYTWIESNRLPAGRCIWLAQNRLAGASAQAHAGAHARLVQFEHYDYFLKIMAWIFSPLNPQDALGVEREAYIERLYDAHYKDKLLLCLNATPRLPRVLTVAALMHHQLIENSAVSFPGMRYVKSGASSAEVAAYLDENPRLDYLRPQLEAMVHMPPLTADAFRETGNDLVEKVEPKAYERSFFSLVTESDFADARIERVTEKTAKAFCMGHPTLVVGSARSVDGIRGFGFEDWGDVLDRRADAKSDSAARFDAVFAEVLRQTARIQENPQGWLDGVREVGTYNFRYAVSGDFLRHYVKRFDRPIVERLRARILSKESIDSLQCTAALAY